MMKSIDNGSCIFNTFLALIFINWILTIWATEFLLHHDPNTSSSTLYYEEQSLKSLEPNDINDSLLVQQIKLPRKVQSNPPPRSNTNNNSIHDPTQLRNCLALTATPTEFQQLRRVVNRILLHAPYLIFDCIHLTLSDHFLRVDQQEQQNSSDSLFADMDKLRSSFFTNERIILHKVTKDYGPMTRYLGPLSFEKNPNTRIVIFDLDTTGITTTSSSTNNHIDLTRLLYASTFLDTNAIWCHQGENFIMNQYNQTKEIWDTFPLQKTSDEDNNSTWNLVHFCRGVSGLLFQPQHFLNFWWNQTNYHESCFWDDDRWVSFQMERQGIDRKVIHDTGPYNVTSLLLRQQQQHDVQQQQEHRNQLNRHHHRRLGSLTLVTNKLKSARTCPVAWLNQHPETYPTARVTSNGRWPGFQ